MWTAGILKFCWWAEGGVQPFQRVTCLYLVKLTITRIIIQQVQPHHQTPRQAQLSLTIHAADLQGGKKAPPSLQSTSVCCEEGQNRAEANTETVQGSREVFTTVQCVCVCVSHAFWSLLYPLCDSLPRCFWSVIWVTSLVQLMESKPPSQLPSVLLRRFIHLHSV